MREHILSKFSKIYDYQSVNNNYYDDVTQVSYRESDLKKKVISNERTMITETIENSDADEFMNLGKTNTTFTVETSDEDELYLSLWSEETRRIENSDADEFVC